MEESRLQGWSAPISTSEDERCQRAERMVKEAMDGGQIYGGCNLSIISKGSYKNNTNVRLESDVDVTITCNDFFYYKLPQGCTIDDMNIAKAEINYQQLHADVVKALCKKFGSENVKIKSKCINIIDNTCRVSCDVTPTFRRRLYRSNKQYHDGVCYYDQRNNFIENYPEQHFTNGVTKNISTNNFYKKLVRIMKKTNLEISDSGPNNAISSFLIESLLWNIPNTRFTSADSYLEKSKNILQYIYSAINEESVMTWKEVSNILPLFSSDRKWSPGDVKTWTESAWNVLV